MPLRGFIFTHEIKCALTGQLSYPSVMETVNLTNTPSP